jgi:predicted SnoaL-like aldol condensation-catalyzing enzyme
VVAARFLQRGLNPLLALAGVIVCAPAVPDTAIEAANKTAAMALFAHIYNDKSYADAAELLGPHFVQHTPTIADGRAGLARYIERLRDEQPDSSRQVKRVLTDGDYVIIQSHLTRNAGDRGAVAGDIFRIVGGYIVEHWGIVHAIPEDPNADNPNDVFGTSSAPFPPATSVAQERRNLALAVGFYNAALNEKNWEKAESYIGENYRQHSIYMADGRAGFKALVDGLIRDFPQNLGEIKQSFADGDMVVLHLHVTRTRDVPGWTVIELMRLENEKVVEHWDMFERVPATSANDNTLW